MPATNLELYAGSTYDVGFGGAGFPWAVVPTPTLIGDASNVQPDTTFGLFQVSGVTPRTAYAEYRLRDIPIGIVSIASIRLLAWVMATGTAGTFDTDVSAMVRPEGNSFGASGDYYSAAKVLTSHSSALEIFGLLEFAAWTVNPFTSAPWTKSNLAAGTWGIRFEAPAAGVSNPSIKLGRLYWIIEATSIAADTGGVRTVGSMVLNQFCRAVEPVKVVGPPELADIGVSEIFFMSHPRGRRPNGPGWGRKPWQRGALLSLEKSIDPITGQVTIQAEDRRLKFMRLWLAGLTTVGPSLDGQGVPILHSGGGPPVVTRDQVKYIQEPGNPTDHVMKGITEDLLAHDYRGMCIEEGDDTNLVLNSTFSQGSGDTFDNWTASVSGSGSVTQETARVGVDEIGLRRSAHVDVGVTDSSVAIVSQDVTVAQDFRVMIFTYNNYGSGALGCVLQRASDSKYWRDSDQTWQAVFGPSVISRIGNEAGFNEWNSKLVDAGGGDTISVKIGYFGEPDTVLDGIGFQAFIWSVDLVEGEDHVGTPLITTDTPVARTGDIIRIPNNEVGRWWGFERGFSWSLGAIPLWNAADLAPGTIRVLLHVDHGEGSYSQILFQRASGDVPDRFLFSISMQGIGGFSAQYVVTDQLPTRGTKVKLSGYYIGDLGEQDKSQFEIGLAVNDDWSGGDTAQLPSAPAMDATSTGYLGHFFSGVHEVEGAPSAYWNGFERQVRVYPIVLTAEELQRKPS